MKMTTVEESIYVHTYMEMLKRNKSVEAAVVDAKKAVDYFRQNNWMKIETEEKKNPFQISGGNTNVWCAHVFEDQILTSYPPKKRCIKCWHLETVWNIFPHWWMVTWNTILFAADVTVDESFPWDINKRYGN